MHYQIFLPGQAAPDPQSLVDVGLEDHVENAAFLQVPDGPTGAGGSIVAWLKPGAMEHCYRPEDQEWIAAVPCNGLPAERYWVGFWEGRPPTPDDLSRPFQYRGRACRLGDGKQWLIPREDTLPNHLIRNDGDGSYVYMRQQRFHEFGISVDLWRARLLEEGENIRITHAEAAEFVESALRLNYRLATEAVSRLLLFDSETIFDPMMAVLERDAECLTS